MATSDTEEIATGIIKNQVLRNKHCLRAFVNENDKTPLWDGVIYVYNDEKKKNENYEGKIDVQIKGRKVSEYTENNTFSIDVSILQGYQKEVKGTLLFVVDYIDIDNYKIFYCNLLPIDLFDILNSVKEEQQTVSLKLKEITNDGILTFKNVCLNFYKNSNVQAGMDILSEKDFNKIETMKAIGMGNNDMSIEDFVNGDIYTYAKLKDSDKEYIMTKPEKWVPFQEIKKDICINGKKYYSSYTIYGVKKEIEEIHIGQTVISLKDNKVLFNTKGSIEKRIKVLEFVLALLEYRYIMFDGLKIDIPLEDETKITEYKKIYSEQLDYFKSIKKVFKLFKFNIEIPFEELDDEDIGQINALLNLYKGNFNEDVENYQRFYVSICGYKLIFIEFKQKNTIFNYYSNDVLENINFTYKEDGHSIRTSIYCTISEEDIKNVYNLNEKIILKSFKNIELTDITLNSVNKLIQCFVRVYDDTLDKLYINIADKLSQMATKNRGNDIDVINSKQIKYRKTGLSTIDKKLLKEISPRYPLRCFLQKHQQILKA